MSNQFTFSVVIPTWNIESKIARTMDSLVNQTYKNFEVIISDDGSKDKTVEVVKKYANKLNLVILENTNWGGPARPRNIAIKAAKSDWIAFLDHDDWWYPNKLAESIKYLDTHDVIFHDMEIYGTEQKITGKILGRNLTDDPFTSLMVYGNSIANSSAIVRKSILEKVNLVDESKEIVAVPDYDLWLKISKVTNKFQYINKFLGGYWLELGQNMTAATEKQIKQYEVIFNKYEKDLEPNFRKKALAFVDYSKARIYHKLKKYPEAKKFYISALNNPRLDIKMKSLAGISLSIFNK
jgi:glycosyltransferase involved in cell wall biosynthesis